MSSTSAGQKPCKDFLAKGGTKVVKGSSTNTFKLVTFCEAAISMSSPDKFLVVLQRTDAYRPSVPLFVATTLT